jgi:GxxExxY protein
MEGINHGDHGAHGELRDCDGAVIDAVLSAATAVPRQLGPGLLESVYEQALLIELAEAGMPAKRQVEVPAHYRGFDSGIGFRADIIVADSRLLEIKAVDELGQAHLAQIMTYLKLLGYRRGYLLNFNKKLMKEGIKRVSI